MAIRMQVDILELLSQWAISTGERAPKIFGDFFYFRLKLTKPQLSIKEILQKQSVKKKIPSFIESNTGAEGMHN